MCLGVFTAHKVEDNRRASAIVLTAFIAHVHDFKHAADADLRPFERLTRRGLLCFFDQLGYVLGLFLLVVRVQRLAVFFDRALDDVAVDEEVLILGDLGLFHLAVRVEVLNRLQRGVGIVLPHLVELLLVFLHFVHQLMNFRQWWASRIGRLLGARRRRTEERKETGETEGLNRAHEGKSGGEAACAELLHGIQEIGHRPPLNVVLF